MSNSLIPKAYRKKIRMLNSTIRNLRITLQEFRDARNYQPSIGFYYPKASDDASFRVGSLYDRVKAGEILGHDTIVSTSDDALMFKYRRRV